MMSKLFDFTAAHVSADGELCLKVKNVPMARQFVLSMRDRVYTAEVKEYRERRSKDANSYLWVLCEELAKAVNLTAVNVYRAAVRDVGVYKDFHNLTQGEAKTLIHAWWRQGIGLSAEQLDFEPDGEHVVMRAYYGSSVYNTKQMSRLIDHVVQDCRAVGVETLTPLELDRLKGDWKPHEE